MAHLQVLRRHRAYQQRRAGLDDLVERCFDRACFSLPEAGSAPEKQADCMAQIMRR